MSAPSTWETVPVVVQQDAVKGQHVLTTRAVAAGEVMASLAECRPRQAPDRYTVQVAADRHIDEIGPFTYLNHSCAPNVFIDGTTREIVALRPIAANEELGFFYPANEWKMAEPFPCHCGAVGCIGLVSGAADLSEEVLGRYRVNAYILELRAAAR